MSYEIRSPGEARYDKHQEEEAMTNTPPPSRAGERLQRCISACREKDVLGIRHGLCATCVHELREMFRAELEVVESKLRTAEQELTETRRARIGDSEIIGMWMCRAEKAEQERDTAEAQCADAERFGNSLSLELTARDQTIAQLRELLKIAAKAAGVEKTTAEEYKQALQAINSGPSDSTHMREIAHAALTAHEPALTPPGDGPITWYPCACGAEHDTPTCPFGAADGPRTWFCACGAKNYEDGANHCWKCKEPRTEPSS